ncbi:MAG: DNA polymerase III subunit alpha, partial [Clostridia bacterium]|nr:DNA polymerase III subunit alpha [Clostridia bacterium]
ADLVRRAMAKKKSDVMMAEKKNFIEGAEKKGISPAVAEEIFNDMASFASYAFNKSHATAYAMLSYRTAYLKTHYPKEYMAALLTSVLGDSIKVKNYVRECQKFRIRVLPPDINESRADFSVTENGIRFGLLALKNVGRNFVDSLLIERAKGKFTSFSDFIERMAKQELNSRMIESLIKSGAFDSFGVYRSRLMAAYPAMIDASQSRQRNNLSGQFDLFSDFSEIMPKNEENYPSIPEYTARELLYLEKESSGLYFTGHLLDDFSQHIDTLKPDSIADIVSAFDAEEDTLNMSSRYSDGQNVCCAGMVTARSDKQTRAGGRMCFITLEDRLADIEVIVFSKQTEKFGHYLMADTAISVNGRISLRDDGTPSIILSNVVPLVTNTSYTQTADKTPASTVQNENGAALYLRIPSLSSSKFETVCRILKQYPGDFSVILYNAENGKYIRKTDGGVKITPLLLEKLTETLGSNNVILR